MEVSGRVVVTDQVHHFDRPVDDVWAALTATDRYRSWWPWLRTFDGTDFRDGSNWECEVRSPLGYTVRFRVSLGDVVAPTHAAAAGAGAVTAAISGDIAGQARVAVAPDGAGAALRITSRLTPVRPFLRRLARVAPPLTRWGHDHVMRSGVRRFRANAI